ncbi:MAG: hypothetical protein JSR14_07860 [Proteobacteria bacterium]|nr:hypothetical protein [Pseudomonadota bacterium]
MNHQTVPSPPTRQRFRVRPGLHFEAQFGDVGIAMQLTIDEALSLAMILLYEVREQAAIQRAQGSAT